MVRKYLRTILRICIGDENSETVKPYERRWTLRYVALHCIVSPVSGHVSLSYRFVFVI
ncbi:hypothetical protein SAMN06295943_1601 [Agreia sp. VKM Ac-1783]|nr:hypothetical protein SAMN06295943_1601 [Agreia sp. VKM Ac-1783]